MLAVCFLPFPKIILKLIDSFFNLNSTNVLERTSLSKKSYFLFFFFLKKPILRHLRGQFFHSIQCATCFEPLYLLLIHRMVQRDLLRFTVGLLDLGLNRFTRCQISESQQADLTCRLDLIVIAGVRER